jgi:site-specific DNA recombinase
MIKEIVIIADDTVRPIFKLPIAGNDEGLALDGPALSDSERAVRALPNMVGDTGFEPVTSTVSR